MFGAAGAGLALIGAAALPVQALAEDQTPVQATASQIVVRDAASGQLRAATAAEARALQGPAAARLPGARLNTVPHTHASGARGARLSDDQMSYSLVVRHADGSTTEYCFASREEADAALQVLPVANNNLPTE
jgi:hypothetical protein